MISNPFNKLSLEEQLNVKKMSELNIVQVVTLATKKTIYLHVSIIQKVSGFAGVK